MDGGHRGKELCALECEACHGLQSTCRSCARNLAKAGTVRKGGRGARRRDRQRRAWRREIRVVDHVEGIHSELELQCFKDLEGS